MVVLLPGRTPPALVAFLSGFLLVFGPVCSSPRLVVSGCFVVAILVLVLVGPVGFVLVQDLLVGGLKEFVFFRDPL